MKKKKKKENLPEYAAGAHNLVLFAGDSGRAASERLQGEATFVSAVAELQESLSPARQNS